MRCGVITPDLITTERPDPEMIPATLLEQARVAAGCLEFVIAPDLLDPGRVNIYERWESQVAVDAFRRSGPSDEQGAAMLSASVAEYDVGDVRSLLGESTA